MTGWLYFGHRGQDASTGQTDIRKMIGECREPQLNPEITEPQKGMCPGNKDILSILSILTYPVKMGSVWGIVKNWEAVRWSQCAEQRELGFMASVAFHMKPKPTGGIICVFLKRVEIFQSGGRRSPEHFREHTQIRASPAAAFTSGLSTEPQPSARARTGTW